MGNASRRDYDDVIMTRCLSLVAIVGACFLAGCSPPQVEQYFVPQSASHSFAPTPAAHVLELGLQDVEATRQRLYADAAVLGRSQYVGSAGNRSAMEQFGRKIGADVVLWHRRWLDSRTEVDQRLRPDQRVTTIQTRESDGSVTETTVRTDEHIVETQVRSVNYYAHDILFLRRGAAGTGR